MGTLTEPDMQTRGGGECTPSSNLTRTKRGWGAQVHPPVTLDANKRVEVAGTPSSLNVVRRREEGGRWPAHPPLIERERDAQTRGGGWEVGRHTLPSSNTNTMRRREEEGGRWAGTPSSSKTNAIRRREEEGGRWEVAGTPSSNERRVGALSHPP